MIETVILTGVIYGLVALGFVLIYKATGVLNFAQGAFMMLGAYVGWSFVESLGLNVATAMVASMLVCSVVSGIAFRLFIEPLLGRPLFSAVVATIGVAIVMEAGIRAYWGLSSRLLQDEFTRQRFQVGRNVELVGSEVLVLVAGLVCVVGIAWLFQRSRLGLQLRASAQDEVLGEMCGLNVTRLHTFAWALTGAIAAAAGVAFGTYSVVSVELSQFGFRAFPAAILGGLDSLFGALVGGLLVGLTERLGARAIGGEFAQVAAYILLLVVLSVRPEGLFGTREELDRV